jgi:hypothetical protein
VIGAVLALLFAAQIDENSTESLAPLPDYALVEGALASKLESIDSCAAAANPDLNLLPHIVSLHVAPNGTVDRVTVWVGRVRSLDAETCVERSTNGISLPPLDFRWGYNVDIRVDNSSELPTIPRLALHRAGSLDRADIRAVVNTKLNDLKDCYMAALAEKPGLNGKLVYRWSIAPDGSVTSFAADEREWPDPASRACMDTHIASMRFPPTNHGGLVFVTFPFMFSPGEEPDGPGAPKQPWWSTLHRSCFGLF